MSHGTALTCWALGAAAVVKSHRAAAVVAVLPVAALVGHAVGLPVLYWAVEPLMSYGMAIPTAVALALACGVVATERCHD